MTKPIVTTAFMMLYEEGHFQLTDRVSKYLPYFKNLKVAKDFNAGIDGEMEPLKREITVAHLLSHTAGLSHGLGSNKMESRDNFSFSIEHFNNSAPFERIICSPSKAWHRFAHILRRNIKINLHKCIFTLDINFII